MSLKILKAGILDTLQDLGRRGYQHLGINPTGAMDKYAATIANALVGNTTEESVLELFFPCSTILFEKSAIIALAGADFNASINGEAIPINAPILIKENSILQFAEIKNKSKCYLAISGGFKIEKWMNSYSTNILAKAGGLDGRKLIKNDQIEFKSHFDWIKKIVGNNSKILPWSANEIWEEGTKEELFVLPGNEWDCLSNENQQKFLNSKFLITSNSDRMGYRLKGPALHNSRTEELVSAAVCFGTIQLLPDGQMILLMADHQTTGGYPRLGNIISAHLSKLAQMNPLETICFSFVDHAIAEDLFIKQQKHLLQLKHACKLKLENFVLENN